MVFSQHWALLSACQGARASNNSVVEMYITWSFILCILVWNIDQLCPIDIVHFRVCIVLVSAKLLGGTIDGYRAVSSHNLTTKHRVFSLWPSLTKWRSAEKLHPSWSSTCSIVPAKKIWDLMQILCLQTQEKCSPRCSGADKVIFLPENILSWFKNFFFL